MCIQCMTVSIISRLAKPGFKIKLCLIMTQHVTIMPRKQIDAHTSNIPTSRQRRFPRRLPSPPIVKRNQDVSRSTHHTMKIYSVLHNATTVAAAQPGKPSPLAQSSTHIMARPYYTSPMLTYSLPQGEPPHPKAPRGLRCRLR